jgi:hypothetical protein
MRMLGNKEGGYSTAIISVGQELLSQIVFNYEDNNRDRMDYELGTIAGACLIDGDAAATARLLCSNLAKAFKDYMPMNYIHLLESIAQRQPLVFLDCFLGNEEVSNYQITRNFAHPLKHKSNPLSKIADGVIIDWCEINPSVRYPITAASITAYQPCEQDDMFEWTQLSLTIIDNAPDVIAVLNKLKSTIRPMSYRGSRSETMHKRLRLLSSLKSHKNPLVAEWACNAERDFEEEIRSVRTKEQESHRSRDERFE